MFLKIDDHFASDAHLYFGFYAVVGSKGRLTELKAGGGGEVEEEEEGKGEEVNQHFISSLALLTSLALT